MHPVGAALNGRSALDDTVAGWQSWMHQGYHGPYREHVMRSGLVLQALTYQPTGAVVAAATTSLPEEIGGSANWDYRFGWLRNGSFTLKALWVAACPDEGPRFFDWIAASTGPLDSERRCRSCSGSAASTTSPSTSSTISPATLAAGRCGSATTPGHRSSSTCSGKSWSAHGCCATSSTS